MTIALICAMPMEIKPMVKKLGLTKTKVGKLAIYRGEIDGQPVVSIHTGMGPELADRSTEALFAAIPDITRVIVFGITGAVDDDTKIGALVVPEFVVNSLTAEEYKPDPGGLEARGIMWTTNVITQADELPPLIEKGVVSLDMETAVIGKHCEARGIPWSVRRSISDRATDASVTDEVFQMANMDGTPNWGRVAKFFATKPHKLPAMLQMAKGATHAADVAATAAIAAARTP